MIINNYWMKFLWYAEKSRSRRPRPSLFRISREPNLIIVFIIQCFEENNEKKKPSHVLMAVYKNALGSGHPWFWHCSWKLCFGRETWLILRLRWFRKFTQGSLLMRRWILWKRIFGLQSNYCPYKNGRDWNVCICGHDLVNLLLSMSLKMWILFIVV